jgi:hypothetical protein
VKHTEKIIVGLFAVVVVLFLANTFLFGRDFSLKGNYDSALNSALRDSSSAMTAKEQCEYEGYLWCNGLCYPSYTAECCKDVMPFYPNSEYCCQDGTIAEGFWVGQGECLCKPDTIFCPRTGGCYDVSNPYAEKYLGYWDYDIDGNAYWVPHAWAPVTPDPDMAPEAKKYWCEWAGAARIPPDW